MDQGILYLLPSDFGEDSLILLPKYAIDTIQSLDMFIVENEKSARHFLKRIGYPKPINSIILFALNEHTSTEEITHYLDPLKRGISMGVLSEAGCPGIADPGAEIIKLAHQYSILVKPLVGPSSILLALMASGFNGQHFIFHGYLPKEKTTRIKMIQRMESDVLNKNQTQIFIETPYHNNNLFKEIIETCSKNTKLCIATEITLPTEFIKTLIIDKWKNTVPDLHKRPTVFLLYK
jgi:16S rRNA (cytidine1402-2'-O)-methyltransferase